jgi:hypothetical protein
MGRAAAENPPSTLVSQRAYAKRRGCSQQAVNAQTVDHGGPIPTYGTHKQIDPAEADELWPVRTNGAASAGRNVGLNGNRYSQAKTARMVALAKREAFELRVRKREFVARAVVERHLFAFGRQLRDHWTTWPARIGPELAAALEVDPFVLITHLEEAVRVELVAIADERCTF